MVVRPTKIKGLVFQKNQPIIRKLGKPTVTMMPLDLAANKYFKWKKKPKENPKMVDQETKMDESFGKSINDSFFDKTQTFSNFDILPSWKAHVEDITSK